MNIFDQYFEPSGPTPPVTSDPLKEMTAYQWEDKYSEHSPDDHQLWMRLFEMAEFNSGRELVSMLAYIRNIGAVLKPDQKYGYVIHPVIGPIGFKDREEYERERRPLMQFKGNVIHLLKLLAKEASGDA